MVFLKYINLGMSDNLIRGIQTVMFLLIVLQVSAQQESFLLSGRVLDAKSNIE